MNKTNNSNLTGISQILRKNMTKEEKHLWYDFLKHLSQTFHRQKVIEKYVVDFYCAEAKIVIELDGSQHGSEEGQHSDRIRDAYSANKVLLCCDIQIPLFTGISTVFVKTF